MSILDLQETLREHAADVHDDAVAGRATAAVQRARAVRRRRALAVAVSAVVVGPLVGAAILSANSRDRSAPVVHTPEPTPTVTTEFAGRELLDSRVAQDEGGELTLTHDTDSPTQWTVSCYGVGPEFLLYVSLDGDQGGQAQCESGEPPEPQLGYVLDRRQPTGLHTIHAWVTRRGSTKVEPVPGLVLTAAVYRLPEPVAIVADADVFEREFVYSGEWEYLGSDESGVGHRRLVSSRESDDVLLARVASTGVPAQRVHLVVDGIDTDAPEVLDGTGYLHVLPEGRHTVELRIDGVVPPGAQLGVVWRTLVR